MKLYPLSPTDSDRLANDFTYHPPVHADQIVKFQLIRDKFHGVAEFLMVHCPRSRELSVALTQLELANFAANAAVARIEVEEDYPDSLNTGIGG